MPSLSPALIDLTAVIVAVTEDQPRILVIDHAAGAHLPQGPFSPADHPSLEAGLRQMIERETRLDLAYVEQLYTFGNRLRDPRERDGGPRVVSVAYIALTLDNPVEDANADWRPWYEYLPWEDWRDGPPEVIEAVIQPKLADWANGAQADEHRRAREERIQITFGPRHSAEMDAVLTLERFELLYEAGLISEALRDRGSAAAGPAGLGPAMASDHRRILATALGRLRGKLAYRPVVFDLMPGEFTLLQLMEVVEALSGARLHKQNFRRLVLNGELVEPVGRTSSLGPGRPAELFRFRREVLGEKLTIGVARPVMRGA